LIATWLLKKRMKVMIAAVILALALKVQKAKEKDSKWMNIKRMVEVEAQSKSNQRKIRSRISSRRISENKTGAHLRF
jgi:hypothetical protein